MQQKVRFGGSFDCENCPGCGPRAHGIRGRISSTAVVAVVVLAAAAIAACSGAAGKQERPLSREEVATTWIGLSEDELYMFRVVLEGSGGGLVTYGFLDEEPIASVVESWQYDPRRSSKIVIRLQPDGAGLGQLTGRVRGSDMDLWVVKGNWKRKVFLREEEKLLRRWDKLRESWSNLRR